MYEKAHCIRKFGFEYRRHGLPDPIFMGYQLGARLFSRGFKNYHPLIKDWTGYIVSVLVWLFLNLLLLYF